MTGTTPAPSAALVDEAAEMLGCKEAVLAQEVQAAAPEVARAAEAAALGAIAGDWLIERTYGLSDEGITGWPETNANAYRCAIEDAQSALRERADELTDTDDGSNRG